MKPLRSLFLFLALAALICSPVTFAANVSIADIQYTEDPSGDSPLEGQEVTISGIVTAIYEEGYGYVLADGAGHWKAVAVYDIFNGPPAVGDRIEVTGIVAEYNGMTEIGVSYGASYQRLSSGNEVFLTTVAAGAVAQEAYESVLVKVENVFVPQLLAYGEWVIADSGGYAVCDDLFDIMYFPAVGDQLESVTGIVYYRNWNFKMEPRDTRDIVGDPIPHYALHGHLVTMNDAREVLKSSYVEILGDRMSLSERNGPRTCR